MSQPLKLFDMRTDPLELKNIAADYPEIVQAMRTEYERWFKDVTAERNYSDPSRIHLGAPEENPTRLTWHDSRGGDSIGRYFDVQVDKAGSYRIALRFPVTSMPGAAHFAADSNHITQRVKSRTTTCVFSQTIQLAAGPMRLEVGVEQGGKMGRVECVEIKRTK